MKENNGHRRRRALWLRAMVVVGAFLLIIACLGVARPPSSRVRRPQPLLEGRPRFRQPKNDHKPSDSSSSDDDATIYAILRGEMSLVRLDASHLEFDRNTLQYSNVRGLFCPISWKEHKDDPSTTPMFRDVLAKSPDCNPVWLDVAEIAARARAFDEHVSAGDRNIKPHTLTLGGVVFHESRCGSTLVANLLQAARPAQHRVYSESPPPVEALRQGSRFPRQVVVPLVHDVIYLMSRSTDPAETHVFFKIQSVGTRELPTFMAAFPDTPFLFVFRDPVEVLMSHFAAGPKRVAQANCARSYAHPPAVVTARLEREMDNGNHNNSPHRRHSKPPVEDFCAAHLATLTETAVQALSHSNSLGRAVDYQQLPAVLWERILPAWGVELTDADVERLEHDTAAQYSKGRGPKAGAAFEGDSAHKQEAAWEAVQAAAGRYLQPSFAQLQALSLEQ